MPIWRGRKGVKERMNKYFMAAQEDGGKVLDIFIFGDITSWEWYETDVSSYTLSKLVQESKAEIINVRINSYGGEVAEGLAIYNALKNSQAKVVTECDGFACSAASVVFMAGDERLMNAASLLMVHNAWTYASGNAQELRKAADDLEKISTAAANAYRAVMTIPEDDLNKLLEEETWILPQEAVGYGFATSIREAEGTLKQQYSAKKKIIGQLVSGTTVNKIDTVPVMGTDPEEKDGFQKLFDKFAHKEGAKQ